jgi:hypothetical protein
MKHQIIIVTEPGNFAGRRNALAQVLRQHHLNDASAGRVKCQDVLGFNVFAAEFEDGKEERPAFEPTFKCSCGHDLDKYMHAFNGGIIANCPACNEQVTIIPASKFAPLIDRIDGFHDGMRFNRGDIQLITAMIEA